MPTKQESLFGLGPLEGLFGETSTTSLTTYHSGSDLPALERKVVAELSKERLVIDAQREKTQFGMTKIAELHQHGTQVFHGTTTYIMEIKQQARGKEHQAIIDEFTSRQIGMFGRQVLGAIDVGATNIAVEVHRSLYPVADPPERKGFLQRLFG